MRRSLETQLVKNLSIGENAQAVAVFFVEGIDSEESKIARDGIYAGCARHTRSKACAIPICIDYVHHTRLRAVRIDCKGSLAACMIHKTCVLPLHTEKKCERSHTNERCELRRLSKLHRSYTLIDLSEWFDPNRSDLFKTFERSN